MNKHNKQNQTHRYKEQTGGIWGGGWQVSMSDIVKRNKKYKLPVTKQISYKDVLKDTYSLEGKL